MDSAAPCAFDSESSAPSSDWRRWLRDWRHEQQPEGGAAFSSVTPLRQPQPQSYFQFVGDVTLDDLLVGLDQDLPAPAPLPPPPSPTPPPPPPQSAYSSYSSGNSWLQQQLEGGTSWEELLMNLRVLDPPTGAQDHLPEVPTQPHAGDEIHMLDVLALPSSAGDEMIHTLELQAPPPAGDAMMHMPAPPPDDAMASPILVSGDSEGISADASSSSDSLEDLWWSQILGDEGTSSDDNFSGLPISPSAGRRWPVVAPGESIGVGVKETGTWEAHIWLKDHNIERLAKPKDGHQFFVGSFETEDEAKCAHDETAIMFKVRVSKNGTLYSLNHPEERYAAHIAEHAGWTRRDYTWKKRRYSGKFTNGRCPLKGVDNRKPGVHKATICVTTMIDGVRRKTTMVVGKFKTLDEAGREYDRALLFIKGAFDPGCITNFRPSTYSAAEVQAVGERLAAAYPRVNFQELRRKRSGVFAE